MSANLSPDSTIISDCIAFRSPTREKLGKLTTSKPNKSDLEPLQLSHDFIRGCLNHSQNTLFRSLESRVGSLGGTEQSPSIVCKRRPKMFAPSQQSIQADTHRSSAPMYVSRTTRMRVVVKVHDAKIENVMDKLSLNGIRDSVAERLPSYSIESISARSGCVIMELYLSTQHSAAAASASALERLNTSTLPLTSSSNAPLTESIQSDRLALDLVDLDPASWLQLTEIHKLIGDGSNAIVQVTSNQRASPQQILSSHVMKLNDGAWYDVSSSFQGRGDNPEGGSTQATAAPQLSPSQPRCLLGPHHGSSSLILDMVMYWRESSQSGGPLEEDETESHENSRQPPGNLTLDPACTSAMQGYLHGPMHVITCENLRQETQSASQVSALDGMPSPLALHAKDHGIVNPEGFVALSKGLCVEVTLHGHRLCTRRVTRECHMTVNAPLLGQQWSSSTTSLEEAQVTSIVQQDALTSLSGGPGLGTSDHSKVVPKAVPNLFTASRRSSVCSNVLETRCETRCGSLSEELSLEVDFLLGFMNPKKSNGNSSSNRNEGGSALSLSQVNAEEAAQVPVSSMLSAAGLLYVNTWSEERSGHLEGQVGAGLMVSSEQLLVLPPYLPGCGLELMEEAAQELSQALADMKSEGIDLLQDLGVVVEAACSCLSHEGYCVPACQDDSDPDRRGLPYPTSIMPSADYGWGFTSSRAPPARAHLETVLMTAEDVLNWADSAALPAAVQVLDSCLSVLEMWWDRESVNDAPVAKLSLPQGEDLCEATVADSVADSAADDHSQVPMNHEQMTTEPETLREEKEGMAEKAENEDRVGKEEVLHALAVKEESIMIPGQYSCHGDYHVSTFWLALMSTQLLMLALLQVVLQGPDPRNYLWYLLTVSPYLWVLCTRLSQSEQSPKSSWLSINSRSSQELSQNNEGHQAAVHNDKPSCDNSMLSQGTQLDDYRQEQRALSLSARARLWMCCLSRWARNQDLGLWLHLHRGMVVILSRWFPHILGGGLVDRVVLRASLHATKAIIMVAEPYHLHAALAMIFFVDLPSWHVVFRSMLPPQQAWLHSLALLLISLTVQLVQDWVRRFWNSSRGVNVKTDDAVLMVSSFSNMLSHSAKSCSIDPALRQYLRCQYKDLRMFWFALVATRNVVVVIYACLIGHDMVYVPAMVWTLVPYISALSKCCGRLRSWSSYNEGGLVSPSKDKGHFMIPGKRQSQYEKSKLKRWLSWLRNTKNMGCVMHLFRLMAIAAMMWCSPDGAPSAALSKLVSTSTKLWVMTGMQVVFTMMEAYDLRAAVAVTTLLDMPMWYLIFVRLAVPNPVTQVLMNGTLMLLMQAIMSYLL